MSTSTELQSQIAKAKETLAALEQKAVGAINQPSFNALRVGPTMGSDEQRLLNAFGVTDVKGLLTVNVADYAVEPMLKAQALQLKKMVDCSRLHSQIFARDGIEGRESGFGEAPACRTILSNTFAKKFDLAGKLKAFGSTVANGGDEYVQTLISENYMAEMELEFKVASLFNEIPMPSNPFRMPVAKDFTTARIIAEGAAATDAQFSTDYFEFDAVKWVEYAIIPEELDEDSIVPFIALARDNVIKSHARALETAILNGDDTSPSHMDSNVTVASDARKTWKGLRKLALANSATVNVGSALTDAKMQDLVAAAGRFGINPAECAWILGPAGYAQARSLANVVTIDKFGPNAVVKTGALAAYMGIPIIVSQFVPQNLNASGVYDGVTTTKTVVHLVNFDRFMIGRRRPIRVVAQRDPRAEYDRTQIAAYQRLDFQGYPQSASETSSVLGINVTV